MTTTTMKKQIHLKRKRPTSDSLNKPVCILIYIFAFVGWFTDTITVETGEEEEETAFTCKAKLFNFSNKEWKERGIGTFKVNVRRGPNGKRSGRMIMRADGAGRVMLNSPIFKGMNYGDPKGEAPSTKQIHLGSTEDNRTVPLLLRVSSFSVLQPVLLQ